MRWDYRTWGVMPWQCPSSVTMVTRCWPDGRRWLMVGWIMHFIAAVAWISWRMESVACIPHWIMPVDITIAMSHAVSRRSPVRHRGLPVIYIKGCLGFLIVSTIYRVYLRFRFFHCQKQEVKTLRSKRSKQLFKSSLVC